MGKADAMLITTPDGVRILIDCGTNKGGKALAERFGEAYSCHRLDMDTSGLMVYARTPEAQTNLQKSCNALTDAQISYRLALSDYLRTTGR